MAAVARALVNGAVLLTIISSSKSQVLPSQYTVFGRGEVNGSSPTGHCSRNGGRDHSTCLQPNTSVLFDGRIPTLPRPLGNMWASQLLTLNITQTVAVLRFNFTTVANYSGIGRMEAMMFNCPEWGIGGNRIRFHSAVPILPNITSCDSLVRVCIPCTSDCGRNETILSLNFKPAPGVKWVHIAEVTFHPTTTCTPDATTSTAPGTISTTPNTTHSFTTKPSFHTPTLPQVTTAATEDNSNSFLIIISAVVVSVPFMLVCVVAALLLLVLLLRCRQHKHSTTPLREVAQQPALHPYSPSPPLHLNKEIGQSIHSTMQNEVHRLGFGPNKLHKEQPALPDKEEEDSDGYTIIPKLIAACSSQDRTQEDKKHCADQFSRHYSAITLQNPQSIYTQAAKIQSKKSGKINECMPKEAGAVYAALTKPDPPRVYAQVDRKESMRLPASAPEYAAIGKLDSENVYARVLQQTLV